MVYAILFRSQLLQQPLGVHHLVNQSTTLHYIIIVTVDNSPYQNNVLDPADLSLRQSAEVDQIYRYKIEIGAVLQQQTWCTLYGLTVINIYHVYQLI